MTTGLILPVIFPTNRQSVVDSIAPSKCRSALTVYLLIGRRKKILNSRSHHDFHTAWDYRELGKKSPGKLGNQGVEGWVEAASIICNLMRHREMYALYCSRSS